VVLPGLASPETDFKTALGLQPGELVGQQGVVRSVVFIKFLNSLNCGLRIAGRAIANQLVRAGTLVAANYRSACRARSQADFVCKIGLVEEEADETAFWLELLMDAEMLSQNKVIPPGREADELTRIMVASSRTVRPRR
jgi:four helix bundle protein